MRNHPVIEALVINNLATLKELQTYYDIEDVLDLYEMLVVNIVNKYLSVKEVK